MEFPIHRLCCHLPSKLAGEMDRVIHRVQIETGKPGSMARNGMSPAVLVVGWGEKSDGLNTAPGENGLANRLDILRRSLHQSLSSQRSMLVGADGRAEVDSAAVCFGFSITENEETGWRF